MRGPMSVVGYVPEGLSFFNMDDKQRTEVKRRMQPGCWSDLGFLKAGQLGLEISMLDREILEKRQVTYREVAKNLDELKNLIFSGNKNAEYQFDLKKFCGSQICPFSFNRNAQGDLEDCAKEIGNWEANVIRIDTGEKLFFTGLHAHLIRYHGFFEDGHYRLDPEKVCKFFRL